MFNGGLRERLSAHRCGRACSWHIRSTSGRRGSPGDPIQVADRHWRVEHAARGILGVDDRHAGPRRRHQRAQPSVVVRSRADAKRDADCRRQDRRHFQLCRRTVARSPMTRVDPVTNTTDIWIARSRSRRVDAVHARPANDLSPVWSPDGAQIVFRSDRSGDNLLYRKGVDRRRRRRIGRRSSTRRTRPTGRPMGGSDPVLSIGRRRRALTSASLAGVNAPRRRSLHQRRSTNTTAASRRTADGSRTSRTNRAEPEVYVQPLPTDRQQVDRLNQPAAAEPAMATATAANCSTSPPTAN